MSQAEDCGPVVANRDHADWEGAEAMTNNTGELMAILRALKWLRSSDVTRVQMRYDSTYAANMVQGKWEPKKGKNVELINNARQELQHAQETCEITWRHVKAHTAEFNWNHVADELANKGREEVRAEHVAEKTRDAPGEVKLDTTSLAGSVRWVAWQPTETGRVLRSLTHHGALNLPTKVSTSEDDIRKAKAAASAEIWKEKSRAVSPVAAGEAEEALAKIGDAAEALRSRKGRLEEVSRSKKAWVTRTLKCRINVTALRSTYQGTAGR